MQRIAFFFLQQFFFKSVINFIHISVYMSIPIAQFSTPPSPPHRGFPPLVSIRLFSTSVSHLLPWKPVHLYHFSRFYIHPSAVFKEIDPLLQPVFIRYFPNLVNYLFLSPLSLFFLLSLSVYLCIFLAIICQSSFVIQ